MIAEKTATTSVYPLYELGNTIGTYSVIWDSNGNASCIIQIEKVTVKTPIKKVK